MFYHNTWVMYCVLLCITMGHVLPLHAMAEPLISCTKDGCLDLSDNKCPLCRIEISLRNMPRHMQTHTGEKNHTCGYCHQAFSRLDNLKTHERIHTGERPYVCAICRACFAQLSTLNNHKATHIKESLYTCLLCSNISFVCRSSYYRHMKEHRRVENYACIPCAKTFPRQYNLERHCASMCHKIKVGAITKMADV
jgi:hypothetical protein